MLSTAYTMIDLKGASVGTVAVTIPGIWKTVEHIKKPCVICNYKRSGSTVMYENEYMVPVLYDDHVDFISIVSGPTSGMVISRMNINNDDTVLYIGVNVQNPTP